MKKSHMTYAIIIYNLSIIFGAVALPFLSGSLLKIIALIIIFFWLERKFRINLTKFDALFFVYVMIMGMSLIYSIQFPATKQRFITNAEFLVLLIATNSTYFKAHEREAIKNSLIWCSRITAFILLVIGTTGDDRLLLSGSMLSEDPNYLNGYFIFGVIAAIQALIYGDSSRKRKLIALCELGLYMYCCLATGSRGGMFCLVAAGGMYFLFSKEEHGIRPILKKILIILGIVVAFGLVLSFLPETVSGRFTAKAIRESNGTNRYTYWAQLLYIYRNTSLFHQIFGFGAGTVRSIFETHGFIGHVAHNLYVEQLLEGGIVLSIAYILIILHLIFKSIKTKDYFSFSIVCGFIVLSLSTSLYAFKPFWAIMMFVNLWKYEDYYIDEG